MGINQRGLVIVSLLLITACDPGTEATSSGNTINVAADDEVVLSGELFYPERIALPDDSILLVEVRSDASPEASLLADERERLEGRQVPIAFQLRVGKEELAEAANPVLRGAIISASASFRVTEAVPLANIAADTDLGMQRLQSISQVAFGTAYRCGPRSVVFGTIGRYARLIVDNEDIIDLEPTPAASGARFIGQDDSETEFWSKGDQAMVSVRGTELPPCHRIVAPSLPFAARGQEPVWHLRVGDQSVILRANYGQQQLHLPAATATVTAAGVNLTSSNQDHELTVLVVPEICHDSMSGMPFPYSVSYRLDGVTHTGCGGETRSLLTGRSWNVLEIDFQPVIEGSNVSIEFLPEDSRVSGQTACNRFLGGFELGGEGMTLGPIATTRQACLSENLNAQEQRLLQALPEVNGFDIDPDGRLLLMADGVVRIIAEP